MRTSKRPCASSPTPFRPTRRPGSPGSATPARAPEPWRPRGRTARRVRPGIGRRLPANAATRVAAWAFVCLVALASILGWLALSAERGLALGRERLLAGDAAAAKAALSHVHWPEAAARASAGIALARALASDVKAPAPPLAALAFFEPESVVEAAIARHRLASAEAAADLLRRAGHPLGPLYVAALVFERGDEAAARSLASASPAPLGCRGLGSRLQQAFASRAAGVRTFVLDRRGALVATIGPDGLLHADSAAAPYVAEALARVATNTWAKGARAVRLTLDLALSRAALEALGDRHGSIVTLDPHDGALLAAVTDPITALKEPAAAFEQRREPASIAKLMTTAAAYRAGHDADASIGRMTCGGVERYGGEPLWCPWPSGRLAGLDHALAVSCNIAFANLAMTIGRERLLDEYRRWGFDAAAPALLGSAGRVERSPQTPRQLADLAIGLELSSVTPLHAALMAAVVANGGRMPEPRLVAGTSGPLGLDDRPLPPLPDRAVIEPQLATRLREAMQAVARYGTAAGLAPSGLELAMKTGTASAPHVGYHVNYIGFGTPAEPALAFCIRVTGRRRPEAIHADAHDVATRLFDALARRQIAGGQGRPE